MTWVPTRATGYNAALSTSVAGVLTKIAGLQSVDFNPSVHMVNVTTVDDQGTEFFLPGTSTWTASGKLALIPGDTTQTSLMNALLAKTQLSITFTPIDAAVGSGAPTYTSACYVEDMKMSTGGVNTQESLDIKLQGAGAFTVGAL